MKRTGIMGSVLLVTIAFSAFAASSAFALPEVGRCVAKVGGKYTDSNCTVKAIKGNGTTEFVKGAVKTGFSSAGGEGVIEGESSANVVCLSQEATGQYDLDGGVIKGVEDVVSTFRRCELPNFARCNSKGAGEGEIKTSKLAGGLGYISGEGTKTPEVGQELRPEVKNGAFAEFDCAGGAAVVVVKSAKTNCLIASVSRPNVSTSTLEQRYKSSKSVQEPQHFERTPTKLCQLESNVNGGAPEKMGLKLETTVTNEEALEIRA